MGDVSRTWLLNPPQVGSSEAMDAFLREVKKPKSLRLMVATDTCFVPGVSAANYKSVFQKANNKWATPEGMNYEFWCEGKGPSEDSSCVEVVVSGNPPVIQKAFVTGWTY